MPDEARPSSPAYLALLPNGEAFRADRIAAVRILEDDALPGQESPRFRVMIEFEGGALHPVGLDLARRDAQRLAQATARQINDKLGSAEIPLRR